MRSNLYVSLSGQVALQKRLETVAHNIANMNTAGFRAQGVNFASVLSKVGEQPAAFVSTGSEYISRTQGAANKTGNPFDIAVQGDGWFAIKTPDGIAYTRDGRMQMSASGELQTLNGYQMLDAGRSAMLLDPNEGPPVISADGMITQNGRQVGAVGLFAIPNDAKLDRYDNSAIIPDAPPTAILDFSRNSIVQGFSESSNVNPVLEMTKLIEIQRTFDEIAGASKANESAFQDAIKTLGSTS